MSNETELPPPGVERDKRIAELRGDTWDETRCRVCGCSLAVVWTAGCVKDNCARRPAPKQRSDTPPRYSTDLNAAVTLRPDKISEWRIREDLDGWTAELWTWNDRGAYWQITASSDGDTPADALSAAYLRYREGRA